LTSCPQRHWSTRSPHHGLTAATPCLPGRIRPPLNAAARVVSGTHKFDRGLTHLLHSELHWLDVPQRIQFKLGVTVHRCMQGNAPQYLVDCCKSTTDVASRQRLRSAAHRATSSLHQVRPSGVFCCRSDRLELAPRLYPQSVA